LLLLSLQVAGKKVEAGALVKQAKEVESDILQLRKGASVAAVRASQAAREGRASRETAYLELRQALIAFYRQRTAVSERASSRGRRSRSAPPRLPPNGCALKPPRLTLSRGACVHNARAHLCAPAPPLSTFAPACLRLRSLSPPQDLNTLIARLRLPGTPAPKRHELGEQVNALKLEKQGLEIQIETLENFYKHPSQPPVRFDVFAGACCVGQPSATCELICKRW